MRRLHLVNPAKRNAPVVINGVFYPIPTDSQVAESRRQRKENRRKMRPRVAIVGVLIIWVAFWNVQAAYAQEVDSCYEKWEREQVEIDVEWIECRKASWYADWEQLPLWWIPYPTGAVNWCDTVFYTATVSNWFQFLSCSAIPIKG